MEAELLKLLDATGIVWITDYRIYNRKCPRKVATITICSSVQKQSEEQIFHNQFGLINGVGTSEAFFGVQVLIQRCRGVNCVVYTSLIDYEKSFDHKMISILEDAGLDDKDIRIILYFYQNLYSLAVDIHFVLRKNVMGVQ